MHRDEVDDLGCQNLGDFFGGRESGIILTLSLCVINALSAIIGTLCNVFIIVAVLRTSSLHTPSIIVVSSLAFSDMLVGILVQPSLVTMNVGGILGDNSVYCKAGTAFQFTAVLFSGNSFFVLTLVSAERLTAMHFHLRYSTIATSRKILLLIVFLWVVSLVIAILRVFVLERDVSTKMFLIVLLTNMLISLLIHLKLIRIINKHKANIRTQVQVACAVSQRAERGSSVCSSQGQKSVWTVIFITGLIYVCFLPFLTVVVIEYFIGFTTLLGSLYFITETIIFVNSTLNPLIFCYRIREIRRAVIKMLRNRICKTRALSRVSPLNTQVNN